VYAAPGASDTGVAGMMLMVMVSLMRTNGWPGRWVVLVGSRERRVGPLLWSRELRVSLG